MKRVFAVAVVLALSIFAQTNFARAAGIIVPAEDRYEPYSGVLPTCGDQGVLDTITSRFDEKEANFWNDNHVINGYERIREIGFRSNGVAYIPRRYCVAEGELSDRVKPRAVIYAIIEKAGLIGWGYDVEWCVVGLDRNLAYAPGCSSLRPFVEDWKGENVIRAKY
jgi:hypothetical protein